MAKRPTLEQVFELRAQAAAARRAADASHDVTTRDLACAAAATLDSVANSQLRRIEADDEPILVLPENASTAEMRQARLRRSVRRGDDLYLPSWREAAVGMPNVLLRSALFAAAETCAPPLMDAEIASQGDVSLKMTGHRLGDYDRRVFAVCLSQYRTDLPLSHDGEPSWVRTTFWQFAKGLNVTYGPNVHKGIRNSLIRLNAAHLRVRIAGVDVPMPRLIDVVFQEGYDDKIPDQRLRGSDVVSFRVQESMANLFGPKAWTAVSESALHDYSGLPAWLACFYSTHNRPFALKIEDLWRYSGVVCDEREFRRRLKTALTRLQADDVPSLVRVAGFKIADGKVTVELVRWAAAAASLDRVTLA